MHSLQEVQVGCLVPISGLATITKGARNMHELLGSRLFQENL